ncbi:MAG: hypothetical protein HJJLKODD_03031 [Phycisphaerae bacterium]|nr:hypothetical protein [Phycisphaerae bacterium]
MKWPLEDEDENKRLCGQEPYLFLDYLRLVGDAQGTRRDSYDGLGRLIVPEPRPANFTSWWDYYYDSVR